MAAASSLVLCSGVATGAVEESASHLTLAEAVALGLGDSFETRIARLERGAAIDSADELRGAFLPQFFAVSQAGYSNRMNEKLFAFDQNGNLNRYGLATMGNNFPWIGVYVDQILFDLAQRRLIEREELAAEAASIAADDERDAVALAVLRGYSDVVRLEELGAVARDQEQHANRLDGQAHSLLDAGRALPSERELAGIQLEAARLEVLAQEGEATAARDTLWRALGGGREWSGRQLVVIPASLPDPAAHRPSPADADDLLRSPELRILDLRRRMEQVSVDAARARRLPTLKFRTGYNNYGSKRYDNFQDEVFVGVDIRLPFFDGFQTENAIDGAAKAVEIARLRYESARFRKQGRVRQLALQLEAADARLALAERRVAAAAEQLHLADVNLRAERGTLAQALAAREQAGREAREAIESRFERLHIWASLLRETGHLTRVLVGPDAAAGSTPVVPAAAP